jgi:hypothetical protein
VSEDISLYRITGIFERVTVDETGRFKRVYEVKFVTKSGVTSSVEIPKERFSRAKAEEKVRKAAEEIEAVMSLKE